MEDKVYKKELITEVYYSIIILDAEGNEYEEINYNDFHKRFTTIKDVALKIISMMKTDKELGPEYGVWSYRIGKHELDDDTDWYTIYKLYKYAGKWKVKIDEDF